MPWLIGSSPFLCCCYGGVLGRAAALTHHVSNWFCRIPKAGYPERTTMRRCRHLLRSRSATHYGECFELGPSQRVFKFEDGSGVCFETAGVHVYRSDVYFHIFVSCFWNLCTTSHGHRAAHQNRRTPLPPSFCEAKLPSRSSVQNCATLDPRVQYPAPFGRNLIMTMVETKAPFLDARSVPIT